MNQITKSISLPKVGLARITFYRDKRRTTKDKSVFSLPFDVQLNEKTATGEIIYSLVFRSCRILWSEHPGDAAIAEKTEDFIKEFLFGTLLSVTEPIEPEEAQKIKESLNEFFSSIIKYSITDEGTCIIKAPIVSKESKQIQIILRKKDTGEYFLSDDGIILRSFRPHERGQREKVALTAKKLGIEITEEELFLYSPPDKIAENLYKFIQILSAVYIFYLS
ncbi:DUF1828 domain-containing protein [Thermodesulfovibrio hydrogeniphilus]